MIDWSVVVNNTRAALCFYDLIVLVMRLTDWDYRCPDKHFLEKPSTHMCTEDR